MRTIKIALDKLLRTVDVSCRLIAAEGRFGDERGEKSAVRRLLLRKPMDFVFFGAIQLRLHSLCILQGRQRIFFKGAKFFHIPPPPPRSVTTLKTAV